MKKNKKLFITAGIVTALCASMAVPAAAEESALQAESVAGVVAANAESAKKSTVAVKGLYNAADWSKKAAPDTEDYVNIRKDASITSDVKGILMTGNICTIKGEKNGWTEIESGNIKGYIRSDLLLKGEEAWKEFTAVHGAAGKVEAACLNVRSDNSMTSEVFGSYADGEEVLVLGEDNGWYEVNYGGTTGYVSAEFVKPADSLYTAVSYAEYQSMMEIGSAASAVDNSGRQIEIGGFTDYVYDNAGMNDSSAADDSYYGESAGNEYEDAGTYYEETAGYDYEADDANYYYAANESNNEYTDSYEEETYDQADYDDSYEDTVSTGEGTGYGISASELDLLAAIIHCEAGGECRDGKVAVGACIMNRVASASFPNNITDVIYEAGQFTPAMTGWLEQVLAGGVDADCYEAAQAALNGESPIGGLLYFHAGYGSGLTIGNQTFY